MNRERAEKLAAALKTKGIELLDLSRDVRHSLDVGIDAEAFVPSKFCDSHGVDLPCDKCRDEKQVALSDELDRIAALLRLLGGMRNHAAMADLLEETSGNVALVAEVLRGEL